MMIDIGSIGNIALYIALALGVVYAIYRFRARSGLMSPIMSGIAEGIISTNRQGTIRYLNPAAEELTGWSRSDASGVWA